MPISPSYRIVEYDPRWPIAFEDEKTRIVFVLGVELQFVQHVGSTSVPGLGATAAASQSSAQRKSPNP